MIALAPTAIELATKAVDSVERFSTNDEVCQALSIHNCDNLNSLPAYSLANRIIKYITEKAFLVGWKAALQESVLLNILYNKQEKAEQGIRTSKILIDFISKVISTENVQSLGWSFSSQLNRALPKNKELSLEMMQKVFSVKDFKENKVLEQIQTFLVNKEKK